MTGAASNTNKTASARARSQGAGDAETIIIGAGAAGLAAAHELSANGHSCTILEARNRIGGRIFTCRNGLGFPLELGAEFIHGKSAVLLEWLRNSGDIAVDAVGERWRREGASLRRVDDQFGEFERCFRRLRAPDPDIAFDEFLRRHARAVPQPLRERAMSLVQGFDAADPSKISAREVLEEWSGPAAASGPTFRPARGYDAMLEYMQRTLRADLITLHLGTVVRSVTWRKGHVDVAAERFGAPIHLRAKRAIITLPLGVLQSPETAPGFVRFSPALNTSKRDAYEYLATGPVIKLVLTFTRPFWEELNACRYRDAAFFFAPGSVFPTFWTSLPARTSTLVAWSAGPNASRLAGLGAAEILACASQSLRAIFGRQDFASWLENMAWHDWQRDPYARGAYSYVLVRGAKARQTLARPLQQTLYFAGEACDTHGEAATVAGALRSGADAARQVLD